MPIFHDPERRFPRLAKPSEPSPLNFLKSKVSEERVRTEFFDGPIPDTSTWGTVVNENLQEEYCRTNQGSFPPTTYAPFHPAADVERNSSSDKGQYAAEFSPPSEIKRPRSALHAGDFNGGHQDAPTTSQNLPGSRERASSSTFTNICTSPATSWYGSDPRSQGLSAPHQSTPISLRSRAPSLNSHSSSFVAKAPTTPLTQQLNNTELDFSPIDISTSPRSSAQRVEDDPSPYVGHIDLQQLPTPAESKRSRRSRSKSPANVTGSITQQETAGAKIGNEANSAERRNDKKRRRASSAPSNVLGGYRIPQKGQLQIVIKNPNKTAVKLFLMPYDLEDMEAETKTFIRQRCYSTDPVIEGMLSKPISERSLPSPGNVAKSKPTLRYLIHLNICSPSSGRYYLYQHIRVVFANRVPDNKEQLQTEIHVPQPRYSAYNPDVALQRSVSSSGAGLTKQNVHRRRNSGFGISHEGMDDRHPQAFSNGSKYPFMFDSPPSRSPTAPPIQSQMTILRAADSASGGPMNSTYRSNDGQATDTCGSISSTFGGPQARATPAPSFHHLAVVRQRPSAAGLENCRPAEVKALNMNRPLATFATTSLRDSGTGSIIEVDNSIYRFSPLATKENNHRQVCFNGNGTYSKLSRGDAGYGGRPSTPELGEGLLAKKLKGLEVQRCVCEKDGDTNMG
ncbi:MAG: hypothetical protein Q9207_002968 [Kuettlingeria erythrocarpa]